MSTIIRLVPGLIAAVAAFIILIPLDTFGFSTLNRLLLFLIVYIAVAVIAERALRTYQ